MALDLYDAFKQYLSLMTPVAGEMRSASAHRESVASALSALEPVSMDETGSLVHGTAVSGHCDSDYFLWLPFERRSLGPTSNLNAIRDRLKQAFPRSYVRVSRPAVAIYFTGAAGTVEVVPAFYSTTRNDQRVFSIPDPAGAMSDSWILSSPDSHLAYVDLQDLRHNGEVKQLTRLLKAWKYHHNVPISSFYLEMQAARHCAAQAALIYSWDLRDVLENMCTAKLCDMNDPSGAQVGRIGARSSDTNRDKALSQTRLALAHARKGEHLRTDSRHAGK